MKLTRQQLLPGLAVIAVLIFGYDRWVLTPALNRMDELDAEAAQLAEQIASDSRALRARRDASAWRREVARDALGDDPAVAEARLLHALRQWSRDARLTLSAITPQRPASRDDLRQVAMTVTASGSMKSMRDFLFQIDHASLPLRVERLRIAMSGDDPDDLKMQLRVTTLYRAKAGDRQRMSLRADGRGDAPTHQSAHERGGRIG